MCRASGLVSSSYTLAALLLASACDPGGGPFRDEPVPSDLFHEDRSAARNWNEALLSAIRLDLARPTVHARNLFHSSAMMYDLWAAYDASAEPYFLGNTVDGFECPFPEADRDALREQSIDLDLDRSTAISYAMYTLLTHRFQQSPGRESQLRLFAQLLDDMGYSAGFQSRDYMTGSSDERAAALGLYLADCVIAYGLEDGANEEDNYANRIYTPRNEPLEPDEPGNPTMTEPNFWQPMELEVSIDQAGNVIEGTPAFVGAEWGAVRDFAIPDEDCAPVSRDGFEGRLCNDPGPPPYLEGDGALPEEYKWNHSVVLYWSSHLDPSDGVMMDISPASLGNTTALPEDIPSLRDFYDTFEGGVPDQGHPMNPATGEPYEPNMVKRGDYTRILAEFWADGPDSETPPGHWFTIVNDAVSDHPEAPKRYKGAGEPLDDLEWDVKIYFALGGAVHDAAVTAWGIKGAYDYVRPVSAIRYMASLGQSTDDQLDNYHPDGLELVEGFVEVVDPGDPLAGDDGENVGKIKVYAWRGPDHVDDAAIDYAGVGWILAENWWPYQRPSFVSPPFAGYISGHSTFSRAAAEILTAFTGDEFFPGGMGVFRCPADKFLVFEEGPTETIELQWGTYRDASDQTSLSRIWGGIHPPVDDVPGRRLGIKIAGDVMTKVDRHFAGME